MNIIKEIGKDGIISYKYLMGDKYIYLNSKYNPYKEAERFIENSNLDINQNVLFFGCVNLYQIFELLKKINKKVYIIILNNEIFDYIYRDNILNNQNIELVFEKEENILISKISKIISEEENLNILIQPLAVKTSNFEKIKNILEKMEIEKFSTKHGFTKLNENIIKNLDFIISDYGIKNMKEKFKNIPSVIVSAGPSLDESIDKLYKLQNRILIIAVGTVLKKLLKYEIKPDFLVIIDPLDNVYEQVKEVKEKIPCLYIPGVNKKALREIKGQRIIAFPDRDKFYEKMNNILEKGYIESGGSVATVALDFAYQLSCNPIIFVGQDLALSKEGKTHTEETKFDFVRREGIRIVDGINGTKVKTLKNYYYYLNWIEEFIQRHKDIIFINSTEYGARIKGTIEKKINELNLKNKINKNFEFNNLIYEEKSEKYERIIKLFEENNLKI